MSTTKLKFAESFKGRSEFRWSSGFILAGALIVLPGLLSVTSNLNLDADPRKAGARFLGFAIGFLPTAVSSTWLLAWFGVRKFTVSALMIAIASLNALIFLPAWPESAWFNVAPVIGIGAGAAGTLIGTLFGLQPWSDRSGSRSSSRFIRTTGFGCILSCLAAAIAYVLGWNRLTPGIISLGALACLCFWISAPLPSLLTGAINASLTASTPRLRSITAFLLVALLLAQVAAEWSIAAWLPLFLIHRLGSGPVEALLGLSFYFASLLLGKMTIGRLAARFPGPVLPLGGAVLSMVGFIGLTLAGSAIGIGFALLLLGFGFAPPYFVAGSIFGRDLHLEPSFYRSMVLLAVTAAMFAAWLLGYLYRAFGITALILFPLTSSVLALISELLLMFESHVMGEHGSAQTSVLASNRRTY